MDLFKLGKVKEKSDRPPINPIEIFERRPSLEDAPNDLWRGQAEALETWHAKFREDPDVLVTLNTGAGKTIVGLLMAQSLVNEGIYNVVYACATIDLVYQTQREAALIGLACTTRVGGEFNNELFESGRAFCITTYHAIFNGRSHFRRQRLPGAVVFDDAHVAEAFLRDALTLTVDVSKEPDLFNTIARLFGQDFADIGRTGEFRDALSAGYRSIVLVPPAGVRRHSNELSAILGAAIAASDPHNHKFAYGHLRDRFAQCAVLFGSGTCEIAPAFLPSLALEIFDRRIRRIYLSATLQSRADFVRAFGRLPSATIAPRNDAGNGERLVLSGEKLSDNGFTLLLAELLQHRKVLIAVPNYAAAGRWQNVARPPSREEFSSRLNAFRESTRPDAFILVSRVDGIDLPHDTCRVMIIDGLPTGTSLIERFLWEYVDLRNLCATKLANRVVQLLGRINRGRNDYGVFVLRGRELTTWLDNDRNAALLPQLIQQQIALGRFVQSSIHGEGLAETKEIVAKVLDRAPDWLTFYSENVETRGIDPEELRRAQQAESDEVAAAEIGANYARHLWEQEPAAARRVLEESVEAVTRTDSRLGGWHQFWLAAAYDAEGDADSADSAYRRARNLLGVNFAPPPVQPRPIGEVAVPLGAFAQRIYDIVGINSEDRFRKEMRNWSRDLAALDGGTPPQMEAALRGLGELLGFDSTRPDNDLRTGPDVLWCSAGERLCLPFELKTDKTSPATYFKGDIKDGHDHLSFVANKHKELKCIGAVFVGPSGKAAADANPTDQMWQISPGEFSSLRDQILAIVHDVRRLTPLERKSAVAERCNSEEWRLADLFSSLQRTSLARGG